MLQVLRQTAPKAFDGHPVPRRLAQQNRNPRIAKAAQLLEPGMTAEIKAARLCRPLRRQQMRRGHYPCARRRHLGRPLQRNPDPGRCVLSRHPGQPDLVKCQPQCIGR